MKNKWIVSALVIAVCVAIAGGVFELAHLRREGHAVSQTMQTVTVAQAANTLLYLPLYVAVDEGYLKDSGINLKVTTSGGDSQAFAALASGQAQFAQGDPTFVAISHSRGGPGIVVASVLDRVAFWGVSFDSKLQPFSSPTGFRGLNVVTFPAPNTAYVVQKDLDMQAGLELGENTHITQAAFGSELAPLQSGKAQIAVTIEPTVSNALAQGAHIVYSYPDAWGPFALTGLMTTEDYARTNSETVQAVVFAYERALQLIYNNPHAAVAVAKDHYPEVSQQVLQDAVQRLVAQHVFPQHAMMSQQSWDAAIKLREETGDLTPGNYDSLNVQKYGIEAMSTGH